MNFVKLLWDWSSSRCFLLTIERNLFQCTKVDMILIPHPKGIRLQGFIGGCMKVDLVVMLRWLLSHDPHICNVQDSRGLFMNGGVDFNTANFTCIQSPHSTILPPKKCKLFRPYVVNHFSKICVRQCIARLENGHPKLHVLQWYWTMCSESKHLWWYICLQLEGIDHLWKKNRMMIE